MRETIRSYMQIIEAIRSIGLALLFLSLAPVVGIVAGFAHDGRYDELRDDW